MSECVCICVCISHRTKFNSISIDNSTDNCVILDNRCAIKDTLTFTSLQNHAEYILVHIGSTRPIILNPLHENKVTLCTRRILGKPQCRVIAPNTFLWLQLR